MNQPDEMRCGTILHADHVFDPVLNARIFMFTGHHQLLVARSDRQHNRQFLPFAPR
ncbi:MAG: hypothetical protein AB7O44_28130 [Hyphomicrobiaceae bacterium]